MNVVGCNQIRFKKRLSTPNEQGKPVKVMEFNNPREEYVKIAAFLKKRLEAGENLENTAVLFRTNQEAEGLVGALMEYQIPFTMKEQLPNLFRHWISRNLMAYLKNGSRRQDAKAFPGNHEPPQPVYSKGCPDSDHNLIFCTERFL